MIKNQLKMGLMLLQGLLFFTLASQADSVPAGISQLNHFKHFFDKNSTDSVQSVPPDILPKPYNYLLFQPLMTVGVEKYYQRTAEIKSIFTVKNEAENTYSRAIIMLIGRDKDRNDNPIVVELAVIKMNFQALPDEMIKDILYSSVPFGKLLVKNNIQADSINRSYFSLRCTAFLMKYLPCQNNEKLYGRTNTLIRRDNKQWLAHVIEILSGSECKDKDCKVIH